MNTVSVLEHYLVIVVVNFGDDELFAFNCDHVALGRRHTVTDILLEHEPK